MKKIIAVLLFFSSIISASAQDEGVNNNQKAREKISAARAAYITQQLDLTPDEAEKFWPVYNEYTKKRKTLRQQFRQTKKTDIDDSELLEMDLKTKQQELDLEKEYSPRFVKIITAQKLVLLKQAESDFKKLLLQQIEKRQGQKRKHSRVGE